MPEPSAQREKLYGKAYRDALGKAGDLSHVNPAKAARRRENQQAKRGSQPAATTEAARRGRASRAAARQQVAEWKQQGLSVPKKIKVKSGQAKGRRTWVQVYNGGLPSLGKRT